MELELELHRKNDHFVKVGILIARFIMVIYFDLENGLQKNSYEFIFICYK